MRGATKSSGDNMDRPKFQEGIAIDWDFIDQRDAATKIRMRDAVARGNLKALRDGVKGTKIGPELSEYLWEKTRTRTPDEGDKREAALLAKQGYANSFIGKALELSPDRVIEALA
jgi:hypothetical protein